ncbi:glutamate 5-kinase [uncultured Vagococcus sp.]|uniref:glutamate 5-kinase n=1 Tax=uncultured Vagococcus sp. TaxID=189676 RepID=UPI0028D78F7F|nr:glutamate 5-kinase [uncultured Vagococcus sp.]
MRDKLIEAKRIVIKVGTSTLMYPNGKPNLQAVDELAFTLSDLVNQGKEVIFVSSGAIGIGLNQLNMKCRPSSIPEQQAVAAIGQSELMTIYNRRFRTYNQQIGQVLLTRDVIDYPESRQNVINTLEQLISMQVVPIINENDSVSVDELDHLTKFGDNDFLSAVVAQLINADLLIMLSDIDGFYSANPTTDPTATLYQHIPQLTQPLFDQAGGNGSGSQFGTGGMLSKLNAAKLVLANDQAMVLANGKRPKIMFDILEGRNVGTLFSTID